MRCLRGDEADAAIAEAICAADLYADEIAFI